MSRRAGIMRRTALAIVLVILTGGGVFYFATGGSWRVDDWVMRQIVRTSNTYLVPQIAFSHFKYTAPASALFTDVTFTAPDGTEVITADRLSFVLAETPRRDKPIVIKDIVIERGRLRLVRGLTPDDPLFLGLVPFVRPGSVTEQESVPEDVRLSEVLHMESIQFIDCEVEYSNGASGRSMVLPGINLTANADEQTDDAGNLWHAVKFDLAREPLLELDFEGRFSLDSLVADIDVASLMMEVDAETISALPIEVQEVLGEYDGKGTLQVELQGEIPLEDYALGSLSGHLALDDFNIAKNALRLPITHAETPIALSSGILYLSPFAVEFIDGRLDGDASFDLGHADGRGTLDVVATDLIGANVIRPGREEDAPPLAGTMNGHLNVSWAMEGARESLDGRGSLELVEGSITAIPTFGPLRDALAAFNIVDREYKSDAFSASFTLDPAGMALDELRFKTSTIGGQGAGRINFDRTLDVTFSAGPIERFVGPLGQLGRVLANTTSRLVRYQVTGTLDKPSIAVRPLGIGG